MDCLPDTLPILDATLSPLKRAPWQRIHPGSSGLQEGDWDRVLVEQAKTLAEALRAARLIGDNADLRVLGQQVNVVDVLMAEVERDEDASFRRLVLVEDKLLKSPDAKRRVLAQIVEYSERARAEWRFDELRANPKLELHRQWLDDNRSAVEHSLRQGEFLLVIAGDGIDENLQRLARRFAAQHDPLNLSELCLVSLALYGRVEERLLVPHVVTAVQLHQRELAIRVVVESPEGTPVAAHAERVTTWEAAASGVGGKAKPIAEEDFFSDLAALPEGAMSVGVARSLLASAREEDLHVRWTARSFVLQATPASDALTLLEVGLSGSTCAAYVRRYGSPAQKNDVDMLVVEVMGTGPHRMSRERNHYGFRLADMRDKEQRLVVGLAAIAGARPA
jgi:hypothetical protein